MGVQKPLGKVHRQVKVSSLSRNKDQSALMGKRTERKKPFEPAWRIAQPNVTIQAN